MSIKFVATGFLRNLSIIIVLHYVLASSYPQYNLQSFEHTSKHLNIMQLRQRYRANMYHICSL